MNFSKKDEAYTYDEIEILGEILEKKSVENQLKNKVKNLKKALENDRSGAAVFFMPQTTFDIFSLLQGDNSICEICGEDVEKILQSVESDESLESEVKNHLVKKLSVLVNFFREGNKVKPVIIKMDS